MRSTCEVDEQRGSSSLCGVDGHDCGRIFEVPPSRQDNPLYPEDRFLDRLGREPYEVILHLGIGAGDGQRWPFLPRPASAFPLTHFAIAVAESAIDWRRVFPGDSIVSKVRCPPLVLTIGSVSPLVVPDGVTGAN
ncbi:MAG: hypothetical protein K9M08_08810 [Pirellula sp.]|nr:hypothetical protein [Pirellula sp.]